jgi:hypothetical protein
MYNHSQERLIMSDEIKIDPINGFYRLKTILGDPKSNPPKPPIIPVSKSSWWNGIRDGRYPAGVKIAPRTTAWR